MTFGSLIGKTDAPPVGPVHQVHATWDNRVIVTPDAVNQGQPLPGIAGRLYLFGPDLGHPVKGNGKLTVDLFDANTPGPDGKPKMLERWNIDKDTLNRLLRKDIIGWGYTLFLPWQTYRPDIARVQMHVCYMPENGPPIYAPPAQVTLRADNEQPIIRSQNVAVK